MYWDEYGRTRTISPSDYYQGTHKTLYRIRQAVPGRRFRDGIPRPCLVHGPLVRIHRDGPKRSEYDRSTLVSPNSCECGRSKVGRLATVIAKILLKSAIVDFTLEIPNRRKDLLLLALQAEFHASEIGPFALRESYEEFVLIHRYRVSHREYLRFQKRRKPRRDNSEPGRAFPWRNRDRRISRVIAISKLMF